MVDILISIAAKVAEYTVAPIGRQLGYLFCYKQNVDDLNTKIVGLRHVQKSLQHDVDAAQRKGENIEDVVNEWLTKVDKIITEDHGNFTQDAEHANTKCISGAKFPNLVLRHRLSRRAKKMAEEVATQIQDREKIQKVSYCPPLPNSVENKGIYMGFESRSDTIKSIIEELKKPSVGMVGVCGMGGVGKTMLAKEVARRAKDEEKLFTEVVFTTISKDQNIEKIQQEIGEKLGMQFPEESKDARAQRLGIRLKTENNLLIILDDIWDQLDLEDVGINHKGCKIFFTSRSYRVLANNMGVDKKVIFDVGVLLEHEAMSLFRKIVGDQAEKQDDSQGLAAEIVKECGGLPIAITTVASALKGQHYAVWKNALHELRKSNPINIDGMREKVYTSIKFSYDYLNSVEAKHLLLLCSLFSEDAQIKIRVLCDYGFGLNFFADVNTLEEARNKTDTLVTNLKDRSLLLDGDFDGHVKLHDVIRDVVISVASNSSKLDDHPRMHNIRNADELEKYVDEEMFKDSAAISLSDIKDDQYPQTLKSPDLKLLRLAYGYGEKNSRKLPHQLFEELNKLLVLDLKRVSLEPLPAASLFCVFPKLQTLRLRWCDLEDIGCIGELKNLKILELSYNYSIKELPRGFGKLDRLLSLNLEGCRNLKVIEPNVISSLTRLQELNLQRSFKNWEVQGVAHGDERRNANLSEVKNLPHLIDLNLDVPDINSVPKDMLGEQWKKYNIRIGSDWGDTRYSLDVDKNTSRRLKLKLCPNSVLNEHDFEAFLKTSEALYLNGFKSVKSLAFEIDSMGFKDLKHLTVEESTEIQCIVNSNNGNMDYRPAAFPSLESLVLTKLMTLENIIHGKLTTETSFGKLTKIEVSNCEKLKSLFSLINIPRHLKSIEVRQCTIMEEIITHHEKEGDLPIIEISQLQRLWLSQLPKLVQFIATSKSEDIKSEKQSIDDSVEALFNEQVVFPKLEELHIKSLNIRKISIFGNNTSFPQLEVLTLYRLSNLERFCGGDISFPQLKTLELNDLPNLQRFCGGDISFPQLKFLKLEHLPNLERFCRGDISFPQLKFLELENLPNLERFCRGDISFPQLESLVLFDLLNLERFCGGDISFPQLESLVLCGLPNLQRFCGRDCVDCPFLSRLSIRDCLKLRVSITEKENENSRSSVDKQHLSHHKDVVKVELSTESSSSEITCQPHPLTSVEEHHDTVFKTKRLSDLRLWNLPYLQQLPETFPRSVEKLSICEWGIRSKDFATPLMSFQNLKFLMVKDCHGLTSLLSPSTAKSLSQQLIGLGISGCKSLTQVIANGHKEADDDDHEIIADNINIIFSQLKFLLLYDLSSLTSFYSGNNNAVLKFPHLDKLIVGDCPEMKTFYNRIIDCPSLHQIFLYESDGEDEEVEDEDEDEDEVDKITDIMLNEFCEVSSIGHQYWKGDINTTIQKLWEDKNTIDSPESEENAGEDHAVHP